METRKKWARGRAPKPVTQKTLDGKVIAHYPSTKEAARRVYGSPADIRNVCLGRQKKAYNSLWEYRESTAGEDKKEAKNEGRIIKSTHR